MAKRISINAFEKVAKNTPREKIVEWNGIEITVKRTLPIIEVIQFVKEIVDICFTDDGAYIPEVKMFAIKSGILTHYTNLTLPSNVETQYELIYATDAVDMVLKHINAEQLDEIVDSADEKINYICDANIAGLSSKIGEATNAFNVVGEKMISMFEGIEHADIQNITKALGENGIDAEKVVAAYIDQMKKSAESEDAER